MGFVTGDGLVDVLADKVIPVLFSVSSEFGSLAWDGLVLVIRAHAKVQYGSDRTTGITRIVLSHDVNPGSKGCRSG